MSAQIKHDFIPESYRDHFESEIQRVKNGEYSLDKIKEELRRMESKIDDMAEDSEFFDKKKALQLLGWSEAILQDLPTFEEHVKNDLIAAIMYFVNEEDAINDTDPIMGLDDDWDVMNGVLNHHNIELL